MFVDRIWWVGWFFGVALLVTVAAVDRGQTATYRASPRISGGRSVN
jgi:hypothetical protein